MRQLSRSLDNNPLPDVESGRKYIFKNTVWASLFIAWFGLTVMSTIPWFWLMSIDAHWYSTMYSWYTFASTFVSGMALIALFVIYMKTRVTWNTPTRSTCMTWVNSCSPFLSSGHTCGSLNTC
ncbi:hypothetical protein [Paraflavitalea speifideaquila]|uniref:hypothetical protein n=1 Tax=Paraflavitalea speifideaquila TaxID=3076558 RepID=UPI0028E20F7E|nr:hypothetical protein [Paraflavitalea speifideiaquila]